ncbi:DUF4956 domain-containing protein [Dactylosporangium roseum]|uniref:DUF4956 domain-containing protein n=1 Tax=Dactylosporangium roseum TaxID=47989 RepID=A0ABY5YWV6_9ACTN|nr:DUF4956 domain-containing protein [Dactylosporangium roseum]UWZ34224.1 DUF4956 domain-containing protein [Dactylosporangium roseum]
MPVLLQNAAVDLTAIVILGYLLYFRRHGRRDLLLGYVALNAGIFAVAVLLAVHRVDLAVGFGLFAVLSIIRLRSDTMAQGEVGYYFIALVLGLINGLRPVDLRVMIGLNLGLLAVMYVADHPRLLARAERRMVTLDVVHDDEDALRADLAYRLGGEITKLYVAEVDYVRDVTVVDVRYRAHRRSGRSRTTPATHRPTTAAPAPVLR